MNNNIMGLAERGAPVLTVNVRLARCLQAGYDRQMEGRGLGAWQTPLILPFSSWAKLLWEAAGPDKPLLDATRAKALWERIVRSDRLVSEEVMLMAGGVADTSFAAYALMKEYRIPWPNDDIYLTEEAKALKRWSISYERELKRLGFTDNAGLIDALIPLVESGSVPLPEEVAVAGFDEFTPLTKTFLKALEARGTKIHAAAFPGEGVSPAVSIRPCEDEADEVREAARWARANFKPGMKVGFIVPELQRYRPLIRREFAAELDPASVLPGRGADAPKAFNLSLGLPLSDEPLVASALEAVSLGEGRVGIDRLFKTLCSPFISGPDEAAAAARADALLRKDSRTEAALDDVAGKLRLAGGGPKGMNLPAEDCGEETSGKGEFFTPTPALPHQGGGVNHAASGEEFGSKRLKGRLKAWLLWLRGTRGKFTPARWAGEFSVLLKNIGWPGSVKLASAEFQALVAWNDVLKRFSTLDEIIGPIGRTEAAALLRGLCRDTVHQPEGADTPIQVLGLLEAAGLSFDHVWLLGCHENALPPGPAPNPFIPVYMQKAYNVPRSSHERELAFSKKVISRILSSAPAVEVSFPARMDNRELLLSPLFKHMGAVEPKRFVEAARLKDVVFSLRALEDAPPDAPVPVGDEELASITGGTSILKDQSNCPFRAFATYRLGAKGLDEPEPGLSAKARGSMLHSALRYFWEEVGGSKRLKELCENNGIDAVIKGVADRVFKEVDIPQPFSVRFLEIERERLTALLKDWAVRELARGRSFRVKRLEETEEFDIAGLKIKGRIDRIDELEDGGEVVLDYKSGKVHRKDWTTSRPRDPQMLIYSASGRFDAVSFAKLVPGECRFVGLSRTDNTLPAVSAYDTDPIREEFESAGDWDGLMALWRDVVNRLAKDFLSGAATVDPVTGPADRNGPCKYCALHLLCRVVEALEEGEGEGEYGEDD